MKRNKKIIESNPIVYKTKIDTTFALYNKKYIKNNLECFINDCD